MIRAVTNYGEIWERKRKNISLSGDSLRSLLVGRLRFRPPQEPGAPGRGDTGLHEIQRAGSAAVCRQPRASA